MPASVSIGEILNGRYVLERELGEGGMATVYSAKHTMLGHRVAVKIMNAAFRDDTELRERFLREAQTAAALESPHVARVTDFGKTPDGAPFIVMEQLEGEDLAALIRRKGALDPYVAVDFALQACEALREAHGLGLIHRDITPKNLFVTQDLRPIVKVLDFGLVKIQKSDLELTGSREVFGSPEYLSPEQARSARDVDERTDIWALGVCLYEMLSARAPFGGKTLAEVYTKILREPPPPLAAPPLLVAVVMKCLEKDRANRFRSIEELACALDQCLGHTDPSARAQEVISRVHQRDALLPLVPQREVRFTDTAWDSSGERGEKKGGGVWLGVFTTLAIVLAIGMMRMMTTVGTHPSSAHPQPVVASSQPPPAVVTTALEAPPPVASVVPAASAKPAKKAPKTKRR